MPALPGHMVVGRGNVPGPVIGGYVPFTFGSKNLTAGGTATDEVWFGFIAPCDMRLQQISWGTGQAVTANVTMGAYKHASAFQAAGGTALLTAQIDLDASAGANKSGFARAESGGATTLVNAARNISKGDRVMAAFSYDATGALSNFHVEFYVQITGHANTNSDFD